MIKNNLAITFNLDTGIFSIRGTLEDDYTKANRTLFMKKYLTAGNYFFRFFDYNGTRPAFYGFNEDDYINKDYTHPVFSFGSGYATNFTIETDGWYYFEFVTAAIAYNFTGKPVMAKGSFVNATTYIPLTYKFKNYIKLDKENYWKNKKILCYGDSLTAWGTWVSLIANYFSMSATNKGIAGSTACYVDGGGEVQTTNCGSSDTRLATLPNNNDIVTLLFGTNDYLSSLPLGTVPNTFNLNDTFDNSTFAGAILKILSYLYTNNQNARIIMLCPPWNHIQERNNHTLRDFGRIVKEIGELTVTPVIDLHNELNANAINYANYYSDSGTHFNEAGNERIAELLINKIKEFTSVQ